MNELLSTPRLELESLSLRDADFIIRLLNTPGWIRFIGDRNIKTQKDAEHYIRKIMDNPNGKYRMVRLKEEETAIGVITFLQRDNLDHPDLGFAFLPEFSKKGYACEAAKAVLDFEVEKQVCSKITAITLPENHDSIRLLEKLGMKLEREIEMEGEKLFLFSIETTIKKDLLPLSYK